MLPLSLRNSSKGYILKRKNQTLGLTEHHGDRLRHYVVGFKSVMLARKVHYTIHPDPIIRLERSDFIDITTEVNAGLLSFGLNAVSSNITIDVLSKLYIPKAEHPGGATAPLNDGGFHLEEQPLEELFMLPFDNNIGIILPTDIEYETPRNIIMSCQVIDPVDSTRHFRQGLPKLH